MDQVKFDKYVYDNYNELCDLWETIHGANNFHETKFENLVVNAFLNDWI